MNRFIWFLAALWTELVETEQSMFINRPPPEVQIGDTLMMNLIIVNQPRVSHGNFCIQTFA